MTRKELDEIERRASAATSGPWQHESFPSGTEYVHMRFASGKRGPAIFGPDKSDQDGHVGAHMNLYNVPAFRTLTSETEEDLHREKAANAEFIAHAREDVPRLLAEVHALQAKLAANGGAHESAER